MVLVVMQTLDNSVTVRRVRSRFGRERLQTVAGHGSANPEWIPLGNKVTRLAAKTLGGRPAGTVGEVVGAPMTAHPIGGCAMGDSPSTGVVDPYHRVYGYDGLHIADGSVVPANLGANPALTITAMAERAMSMWPAAGETDARPSEGSPYVRLDVVS
jgi:cholesterol oxidase